MRFIDDDEVPSLLPYALPHILLLGIVDGGYYLRSPLPRVRQLMLIDSGKNNVEGLAEPAKHLVLPLDRQRCRAEDQNAFDGLA